MTVDWVQVLTVLVGVNAGCDRRLPGTRKPKPMASTLERRLAELPVSRGSRDISARKAQTFASDAGLRPRSSR